MDKRKDHQETRSRPGRPPGQSNPPTQSSPERTEADRRWDQALHLLRGEQEDAQSRPGQAEERPAADGQPERGEVGTTELREERLQPRKQLREGDVKVHKEVETEVRTLQVPVKRERVKVERQPADRPPSAETAAGREGAPQRPITMPLNEEEVEVVVHKRPVVSEEVSVDTRPVQATEHVSGKVRREKARVTKHGEAEVHESGPSSR